MIGSIAKAECTGCKMCADLCARKAITFETDERGFWYPRVDDAKCSKCGACVKSCPSLNQHLVAEMDQPDVYAAWSKDDDVRLSSTSGGIFYEVGKSFIDMGGVVAGCRYTEDWKGAEHVIARDRTGLLQVKGSKYFQSNTTGIYQAVKEELEKNIPVLFCGTPCQNAAMRSYLGKEYDNLYCMDFICRSINSPLAFRKYLEDLEEEYGSQVVEVQLKNKKYGWQSLASRVKFANGQESIRTRETDWWIKGFIGHDLYTRDACFHCKYRKLPRTTADITIGDFWGIIGQDEEDMFKGISVVLLNSDKGRELFEKVKDKFELQSHSIYSVLPGNPALIKSPAEVPGKSEKFFDMVRTTRFSNAAKACTALPWKERTRRKLKAKLRAVRFLRKALKDPKISFWKCLYYNYLSKNIERRDRARIVLYKNAMLDLGKGSKIILYGNKDLQIGYNKLKGSKSETHVRLNKNAVWNAYHGGILFYNTVLEVKRDAVFNSGFFSANGGSVIIAAKSITFGEDVMIGRNVIVYDSDFHQLKNAHGDIINPAEPVVIEDHVWLTSNITVLSGVRIGKDSLIASTTVVSKDVPPHCIVAGNSLGRVIRDEVNWDRGSNNPKRSAP